MTASARTAFLPVALLLASAAVLGCSGAPDGGPGPNVVDHPTGPSSPTDPSSPSQPSEDVACVTSVADYCSLTNCHTTWSDADDTCMNASSGDVQYSTTCTDAYYALAQGSTTSYYASATQALFAVVDSSGRCIAGPADFIAPAASSCPLVTCGMFSCGGPPDGGPDGAMP